MPFPPVEQALGPRSGAPGLLAAGSELTAPRLLEAYRHGIFPWYSEGQPVLWWSTDPRMVLRTADFRISHSLKKALKKVHANRDGLWEVRFDSAFEAVMRACAGPRRDGPGT
ncbi:MAG TPA: leucyl/phenylalanyl-tRNA--protein transferase, partial [Burkholderiaceae bacterium]